MITALGLVPAFFLPLTQDYYDTNKWTLLVGSAIIILILWGLRVVLTGTVTIAWNRTVKGLGLVTIAALVSLLVSPNKGEALLSPFGAGTFLSLFLVAAVGTTFLDDKARGILRWTLMTTVSLTGLLAVYQFFGLSRITGLAGVAGLTFLSNPLWTPVGTSIGLITVIVVTLPLIAREALHRKRSGHDNHVIVAIVMGIAYIGGLTLTAYQILPTWSQTTLPYWVNWQILLESYKNWKQLLLGIGAENFLAAFTAGRPVALNMTPLWNTRFTLGSSTFFHIATVYGVVGAAALSWFLAGLHPVLLLTLVFLPPSFSTLIVVATILIISQPPTHRSLARHSLARLIAVPVFLLAAAASYGLVRAYGAELAFAQSLKALENRDGTATYNLQIQAITANPQIARFHTAYSQTNLALANAISSTATTSATPEQLDRDRQTATQLIQQAIREAKIGVNLAPQHVLAWENIANVYQTLTGVAQGADQWTVAAYQQAMQLDPTNPVIRLRLGGAFIGQQKLDAAAESYVAAISLKPDYANAYYNLAFVYREQKKYLPAAQAIKEAAKYVTPGGDDARRTQTELDELRELLTAEEKQALDAQTQAAPPETTTSPEPLSPLP